VKLSIIIPTLNEITLIGRLIERLLTKNHPDLELIVVDGGSTDGTVELVQELGITVLVCDPSRAKQMNLGARAAQADLLYFVHADTLPPISFLEDGMQALNEGYDAACYRSKFDSKKKIIQVNAFFTRFNWLVSRGGDQSLFIKKATFEKFGGFNEDMVIMEEYPLIEKLMLLKQLKVIPKSILISTRKYSNRSWLKVSRANYTAFKLYKKGVDTGVIKDVYMQKLNG